MRGVSDAHRGAHGLSWARESAPPSWREWDSLRLITGAPATTRVVATRSTRLDEAAPTGAASLSLRGLRQGQLLLIDLVRHGESHIAEVGKTRFEECGHDARSRDAELVGQLVDPPTNIDGDPTPHHLGLADRRSARSARWVLPAHGRGSWRGLRQNALRHAAYRRNYCEAGAVLRVDAYASTRIGSWW